MRPANVGTSGVLSKVFTKHGVKQEIYQSQLFITPISDLENWFEKNPKSIMETFYRWQRKRLGYLMDGDKPTGGEWNYDQENRKPLPKDFTGSPKLPISKQDEITNEVIKSIEKLYPNNPGNAGGMWLPVTHEGAELWLKDFINHRLELFGKYEDAIDTYEVFLYHSVLSPLLNCGLIEPKACVELAVESYNIGKAPLSSVEGFVRQIIGWREYMHGMYLKMQDYKKLNYFGFTKELENWWYESSSKEHEELPLPVKLALGRAHDYAYNHHIERLMVLGNWFLLNEYNPASVYMWFSAMYVDAYEWVMVPNVIGMSQYADGGKVATKPYISGGNYLKKMGRFKNIEQTGLDAFTSSYWKFLANNYGKLKDNYRMQIVLKQVAKRAENLISD
jgi:deoxyribodipyrimidine photolyase-related protein